MAKRPRKTVQAKAKVLEGELQTHEAGTDRRPTPRGGGGGAKCPRAEPGNLQDAKQALGS